MLGFYRHIEEIKRDYINTIISEIRCFENVVVYGAGRVAKPVVEGLEKRKIKVSCFAVTDKNLNEKVFLKKKVYQIDELPLQDEKTIFIICVKSIWVDDIVAKLNENQFTNYICPPREIDYFAREISDVVHRPLMEITTRIGCKVNCRYCPQQLLIHNYVKESSVKMELSFEDYKICLDKLPKETVISFCGFTEPFLNKDCIEMILYTAEKGYDIKLYTTLVGLTVQDFMKIKDIPFYYVVLHVPDVDGYADIPMTEKYFELLDMVLDQRKKDGTHFVDTANCQGNPHPDIIEHTKGKLRIMTELYDRAGNLENEELRHWSVKSGKLYCVRVNDKLNFNVLLPDGRVTVCDFDFGLRHVIGNLLYQSYEELMNSEEMRRIEKGLDDENIDLLCRKCNYAVEGE